MLGRQVHGKRGTPVGPPWEVCKYVQYTWLVRMQVCMVRQVRGKQKQCSVVQSEFFLDKILVRIYSIIEMVWWTGMEV